MGRIRLLSLLAVLGLLFAACGDDDTSSEASDTTAETSEDTADDAGDDTSDESSEESSDEGGTDLSDVDFGECGFLADFAQTFEGLDESAMFGGEDGDFGSFIQSSADALEQVADDAPSEIQDSFRVMADAFGQLAEGLEGVSLDLSDPENIDPEAMQAFEEVGQVFESPEFTEASDEIDAWITENCPELSESTSP